MLKILPIAVAHLICTGDQPSGVSFKKLNVFHRKTRIVSYNIINTATTSNVCVVCTFLCLSFKL